MGRGRGPGRASGRGGSAEHQPPAPGSAPSRGGILTQVTEAELAAAFEALGEPPPRAAALAAHLRAEPEGWFGYGVGHGHLLAALAAQSPELARRVQTWLGLTDAALAAMLDDFRAARARIATEPQ